ADINQFFTPNSQDTPSLPKPVQTQPTSSQVQIAPASQREETAVSENNTVDVA
ncbi:unnamed protein product, partial [Auanema sp. JU1783]